jgi:hypothetical protein
VPNPEERPEDAAQPRPRTLRQMESFVEQRIREAVERGDFDNLETHGRPLRLDLKDAIDPEAWFVNRTMKSLGALPPWVELGKEIDAMEARLRWMREDFARWLQETRARLLTAEQPVRDRERPDVELRFEDRYQRYGALAADLHREIDRFNLEVPVRTLEKPGVWVAHELRRLSEPFAQLRTELGWKGEPERGPAETAPVAPAASEPDQAERRRRLLERWRRAGKRT